MKYLFWILLVCMGRGLEAQTPQLSAGTLQRYENFPSRHVDPRTVDVWLPEGYNPNKRYAVLYMHDGQMLFDSTTTWNKQEWGLDETMGRLLEAGKVRNCIVVGVWNNGPKRHSEYFPQKPFEWLTPAQQDSLMQESRRAGSGLFAGPIQSDKYLKFLVHELKPFIDKHYSTLKGRNTTFIAGSSMGGLISLYAICEYPQVFGGAACISTHWPGTFRVDNNPIPAAFMEYLQKNLPSPKKHKLYFDCGTAGLDALYPPLQKQVDTIVAAKGFTRSNWQSRIFEGEDHAEKAWKKRLEIPLVFLLAKR